VPLLTLLVYDIGYLVRMTRAAIAEVMASQYIRTAVLKVCRIAASFCGMPSGMR